MATPRGLETLVESGVELDALVASGKDEGERYARRARPRAASGGPHRRPRGRHLDRPRRRRAAATTRRRCPARPSDAYGAGDSFAAGLTFGLGDGRPLDEALALGARCGAAALTGRGCFAGQLEQG